MTNTRKRWLPFVSFAIITLFSIAAIYGRLYLKTSNVPIVRFSIPDGFLGPIFLLTDNLGGEGVKNTNGVIDLKIPRGGKLVIRDDQFIRKWHQTKVFNYSGVPVPIAAEVDQDENKIMFFSVGCLASSEGGSNVVTDVYYIGTHVSYKEFTKGLLK